MSRHVHGRPDNEEQNLDDLLGRGLGDPDFHIPPWDAQLPSRKPPHLKYIGVDKAVVERHYNITGRGEGWPWMADDIDYNPKFDEDQESDR